MFKARKTKGSIKRRRKISDDDDDDDDVLVKEAQGTTINNKGEKQAIDEEQNEASSNKQRHPLEILEQKRRERKLLQGIKLSNSKKKLKNSVVNAAGNVMPNNGMFVNDRASEESTVLEKKHAIAMEKYIQSRLNDKQVSMKGGAALSAQGDKPKVGNRSKEDLFEELAKKVVTVGTDAAGGSLHRDGTGEADVGSGGNILGGTGIAEIELKSSLVAQNSAMNQNPRPSRVSRRDEEKMIAKAGLPTTFGMSSKQKNNPNTINIDAPDVIVSKKDSDSYAPPSLKNSIIPTNISQNYQKHNHEWIQKKRIDEKRALEKANEVEYDIDDKSGRIGFAAARGRAPVSNSEGSKYKSSDNKVFKKFVKNLR